LVDLNAAAASARPSLSVVVPTRNEELNAGPLIGRLAAALACPDVELIVVDDSDDDTPQAFADSAARSPLPVRLLHRRPGARKGGLSSAVIAGARWARGQWVLVMDADLQHPPEAAAMLASTAVRHDSDIVVGTRYAGNGSPADGLSGKARTLVSFWGTWLAKTLFPRRLAMMTDPLSGLFAFRRAAVNLDALRPTGFKILLEILVRNPRTSVAEVAYRFAARHAGRSKASLQQGLTFLGHLARLRGARLAGQLREGPRTRDGRINEAARFVGFGLVGLTGIVVNTAALWLFYHELSLNHLLSASLATQVSTGWNFLLIDRLIYRNRAHGTRGGRAIRFFLMNNLLLLARLPVLEALVLWGVGVLTANAVTLVLLFLVRFVLSDRAIFGPARPDNGRGPVHILVDLTSSPAGVPSGPGSDGRKRSRYLPYRYDIAGVLTVGSQILLPEMEFFRAQWVPDRGVNFAVRVGDVGGRTPRRRAAMTEYTDPAAIRYEEHLGRIGANFRVYLGDPISVEVGPLLARSSHVVYCNIIEPLLRFAMVTRGYMLLHSACVELHGTGVMLSALTDTGKTGTVLRLLREHGARFLSDDMTIVDARGNACCFPKPLTISAHTLRAVRANDLTRSEWRRLQLQSRLHSREGRSIGIALSRFNLPIMGINALTQMIVPPPKYTADRLVPCEMARATRVRELFIIERGAPRLTGLDHQAALGQLIRNTDDAYGFPPFRYLAPAITIGGRNYQELRQAERDILASFLSQLRIRLLSSDTFGWADEIPHLVGTDAGPAGTATDTPAQRQQPWADAWPRWTEGRAYGRAG
jgi:dolichol-phosphate mannosyltransferase